MLVVPVIETRRSVELGNISDATCIAAPLDSLISFILHPPLPIIKPHWDAGTINLKVNGAFGPFQSPFCLSKNYNEKIK